MKRLGSIVALIAVLLLGEQVMAKSITISTKELKNKIKGAWAAQVIGVTFGGPTEFDYQQTIIPDYQPIEWNKGVMKWWYENAPGLYDDIYMDLTFVQVMEDQGIDAPASAFAKDFANAGYSLWHANQMARYNILNGIMPPESGDWIHNPHADDIDYEIEADYSGIMSPGMPNAAAEISDKIGHIMNYGDGWYGGVYIGAMYTLAFVSDDIDYIVEQALKEIPKGTSYYQCISDVIKWHKENPDDWKATWFKTMDKWGEDKGCPDGVFTTFNIDAKMNSAHVVLGLLYGDGDFGKTLSISTRAGDDSDCNPGNAAGILGTILGYNNIPDYWAQGLPAVEDMDFKYTTISLNDVYDMSYRHALEMIKRNGGTVKGNNIVIQLQNPKPVKREQGFVDQYPVERRSLNTRFVNEESFDFTGVGFAVTGRANKTGSDDYTLQVAMYIDGEQVEIAKLPTNFLKRRPTPFWHYQLSRGHHTVRFKVLNPSEKAELYFGDLIVYDNKPAEVKY